MTSRSFIVLMAALLLGSWIVAAQPPSPQPNLSPTVDVEGGRALLERNAGKPDLVVLDVRTPAEFAAGHLPGAVNLDVRDPQLEAKLARLDRASTFLVYCRTQNRSGVVASMMRRMGFERVTVMHGGFLEWSKRGFPSEPPPAR
ncbi:MAG: rhodanese-like domain-containing protein [Thermoanaerobaculaceae bacterium]